MNQPDCAVPNVASRSSKPDRLSLREAGRFVCGLIGHTNWNWAYTEVPRSLLTNAAADGEEIPKL